MSHGAFYAGKFEAELNSLIEQSKGNTDGLNIAGVLLRAAVRVLKVCAGHKADSRSEAVREMIQQASHDVLMACDPLPHHELTPAPSSPASTSGTGDHEHTA
jgi:hypothetical protein